jgi:hypothetical protein
MSHGNGLLSTARGTPSVFYADLASDMLEALLRFRTFHLPNYDVEELRKDKRSFARATYAGRLSLGTEDNVALREKYAWELLNTTGEQEYDKRQRKFILEFAGRIFWLNDPKMNREIKEAYKMKTIPLSEYAQEIAKEEGAIEAKFGSQVRGRPQNARPQQTHEQDSGPRRLKRKRYLVDPLSVNGTEYVYPAIRVLALSLRLAFHPEKFLFLSVALLTKHWMCGTTFCHGED